MWIYFLDLKCLKKDIYMDLWIHQSHLNGAAWSNILYYHKYLSVTNFSVSLSGTTVTECLLSRDIFMQCPMDTKWFKETVNHIQNWQGGSCSGDSISASCHFMGNIIKEEEREREKKKKKLAFLIWSKSGMQRSLKVTHKNGNSCWGHFAEGMEDPQ